MDGPDSEVTIGNAVTKNRNSGARLPVFASQPVFASVPLANYLISTHLHFVLPCGGSMIIQKVKKLRHREVNYRKSLHCHARAKV